MRRGVRVLAVTLAGLLAPATASAQWFANPFLGSITKINFFEPHAESPSIWGIAGGAGAAGFVGGEADYTVANEFFGTTADVGSNKLRMITGSVNGGYPIQINGKTRLRPYAAFGGGLGIADRIDVFPDFDQLNTLPPQRQQQIYNCLYPDPLGDASPSRSQIQACGASVVEEQETGYLGVLGIGGGVFGFIVSHVGVRADFRYFWQIPEDEEGGPFNYWRYTIGVVIH